MATGRPKEREGKIEMIRPANRYLKTLSDRAFAKKRL
jgi:hypothetical protein